MRWSSDYFAENDVWSLCIICVEIIVLSNISIIDLTEIRYFCQVYCAGSPLLLPLMTAILDLGLVVVYH
jgi:hypothetical protein